MYDVQKLRDLLVQDAYRVVDEKGKVLPPKNGIYEKIAAVLVDDDPDPPNARHIYTIVKNNRRGLHDIVLKAFSLSVESEKPDATSKCDVSFDPNFSTCTSKERFDFTLSWDDWLAMAPTEATYADGRTYFILQNWTDIFAIRVWEQHGVPCPWTFENAKGNNTESEKKKYYFKITAKCKECSARLTAILKREPHEEDVVFQCRIKDICPNFVHTQRRPLRGVRRVNVANTCVDTKTDAISYVRQEAAKYAKFGGPPPPIIPKPGVVREAIRQTKNQRLGLSGSKVIDNLISAKHGTHVGGIHNVGAYPFFCHYWSKEQKMIYKLEMKNDKQSFMTIDATGGVAKKIKYEHGKSSHIFLYLCMIVSLAGSVPVFQMLSAEQDTVAIVTWLLRIIRDGVPIPRMVVCDFSQALLIAISIAFAKRADLRDYMQGCFDILNEKPTAPLGTYIRLDVSHVVAIICRWDCIKRHPLVKVKQFFIRSLCHAYQIESFTELESFMQSILTVALSQTLGSVSGKKLPSQVAFDRVNSKIKGMSNLETIDSLSKSVESERDAETSAEDCPDGWVAWSTAIYNEASDLAAESTEGETYNACCNLEIAHKIRQLMHYSPIWTAIMSSNFGVGSKIATSSSVESEFANIKHRTFKTELPLRADKFVLRHIDYLDGRVKEASTRNVGSQTSTGPSAKLEDGDHCKKANKKVKKQACVREIKKPEGRSVSVDSHDAGQESANNEQIVTENENQTPNTSFHTNNTSEGYRNHDYECDYAEHNGDSEAQCNETSTNIVNGEDKFSTVEQMLTYVESVIKGAKNDNIGKQNNSSHTRCSTNDENGQDVIYRKFDNHCDQKNDSTIKYNDATVRGVAKNSRSKAASSTQKSQVTKTSLVKNYKPLRAFDNWRGLGEPPQKRKKKPNYMDDCADWDHVESQNFVKLPIIKNGSVCEALTVDKEAIAVKKTCAFDSIIQLLAQTLGKENQYKSQIQHLATENATLKLASGILSRGKITSGDYTARVKILKPLDFLDKSKTRHMTFLNATCNAGELIDKLFLELPSVSRLAMCQNCDYVQLRDLPTLHINVNVIIEKGLGHIQEAIDDVELIKANSAYSDCRKCKYTALQQSHIYGPHLFLDLSILTDPNYPRNPNGVPLTLYSIQKSVVLDGKKYHLSGIIHYTQENEHYTAMTYAGSCWYEYDDLQKDRNFLGKDQAVVPHVIMYAITE